MRIVSRPKSSRAVRLRTDGEGKISFVSYSSVDNEMIIQFEDAGRFFQVRVPIDEMDKIVYHYNERTPIARLQKV